MTHIVLLGDFIFDNAYVAGGPDVVRQLRDILPSGCRATLSARDGAVIADLPLQLQRLPTDATDLVVSISGNDALGLLDRKVTSMVEALELITEVRERFRFDAHAGDDAVLMSNTGPAHGEATSTFTFEGERLYLASLAAAEYRTLLDRVTSSSSHMLRTTRKVAAERLAVPAQAAPLSSSFGAHSR